MATLLPAFGEPWRLTRLTGQLPDRSIVPVPWDAVGVEEHPALQRIQFVEEHNLSSLDVLGYDAVDTGGV